MRPSRLSLPLQAVVLSSLAICISAVTVYTEVTEARQYTIEWSTDAYNTTVQACWDWGYSCRDYLSSFSDSNIIYCEIDNPSTTIKVYCGGNTVSKENVYNDFTQNNMRFVQAKLIAGPEDETPQTPPGWTSATSAATKATTTKSATTAKASDTLTPKQIAKQKADAARHAMHAQLQKLADARRAAIKAAKAKAKAIAKKALLAKQKATKAVALAKKEALQAKNRAALAKTAARKKLLAQAAVAKKKALARKAAQKKAQALKKKKAAALKLKQQRQAAKLKKQRQAALKKKAALQKAKVAAKAKAKKAAAAKRAAKKVSPRRLEEMD
ncbi:hypothetical protein BCR35DRAFT_350762 [Leucosporidium creatinivorum]|uniref:Uncharacterized protein n=1 Tax=Leucosporidium creatinivorum TaxID=106004 RepID=A0A1Y2G052_9BASI|nr:hypothetical protein BCR35DRAFT_350762 [Leucosporidium creatinivorum]